VPFTVTIAEDKQDKRLEEKLRAEAPGILNWLIEGALRWRDEGLKAPGVVTEATDEYRSEMDALGNFVKECLERVEGAAIGARELYKAYEEWCGENNERPYAERVLSGKLKEMGFTKFRKNSGNFWRGVRLVVEAS